MELGVHAETPRGSKVKRNSPQEKGKKKKRFFSKAGRLSNGTFWKQGSEKSIHTYGNLEIHKGKNQYIPPINVNGEGGEGGGGGGATWTRKYTWMIDIIS